MLINFCIVIDLMHPVIWFNSFLLHPVLIYLMNPAIDLIASYACIL